MKKELLDSLGNRNGTRSVLKLVWDETHGINVHRTVVEHFTYVTPDLNQEELERLTEAEPQITWQWDDNDKRYGIVSDGRRFFLTPELATLCKIKCDGGPAATPVAEIEPLPPDPEFDKQMAELKKTDAKPKKGKK